MSIQLRRTVVFTFAVAQNKNKKKTRTYGTLIQSFDYFVKTVAQSFSPDLASNGFMVYNIARLMRKHVVWLLLPSQVRLIASTDRLDRYTQTQ